MNRNFETFLVILYVINIVMSIMSENWVATMAWGCALLAQSRIISLLKND